MKLYEQIQESKKVILSKVGQINAKIGIILGTGLGALVNDVKIKYEISYKEIPNFVKPTVESHEGKLIIGEIEGKEVIILQGRFHLYEGYSTNEITFPVRVLKALGIDILIVSNAAGGLNPQFERGDLMVIEDHIGFFMPNPLIGPNDDRLGVRFPDMSEVYDKELIKLAIEAALEENIYIKKGVYVGVTGPSLETRAEYRMLRMVGADAVGMSTIPEVIVAIHSGLRVLAFSVITDMGLPDALEPLTLEMVIEAANKAEPKLVKVIKGVLRRL